MNRRFALPIAITLSAHAILLLGSRKPTVTNGVKEEPSTVVFLAPPIEIDPPEVTAESELPKGAQQVEAPPTLPPPPTARLTPDSIPMTEPPQIPPMNHGPTTLIPTKTYGDPKASDDFRKQIFDTSRLDSTPRTKFQAPPQYPYAMKAAGITGHVLVEFTVNEAGRVLNPHVLSSDNAEFDTATLRAVQMWRFEPGKHLGKVVRFKMSVPVVFSLSGQD